MSDFPSPPRGSGRHHRNTSPPRYERGRPDVSSPGYLPPLQEPDDLVDSNPGLYRVTLPGEPGFEDQEHARNLGPAIDQVRLNQSRRRAVMDDSRTDLVVPRVYLEPDEIMDKLRARALRVAVVRDVLVIVLGLALVWRWVILPLWTALGG